MKFNSNLMNEEKRNALRTALIQRIDAALDAKEPDMETVDLCTKLLDALEQGSCQPSGRRMRRELARLAQEIDYVPQAHALVQTKPMTVRRALVGAAAVFMCLLLLPIAVILLRGGSQGLTGQESAETSPAVAETAEPVQDLSDVVFHYGDHSKQYENLAACMDEEMPKIYYPTVFPDAVQPISVTVTGQEDGNWTQIGFSDERYAISVRPWNDGWDQNALEDGWNILMINEAIQKDTFRSYAFDAYQKDTDDGCTLAVHIDCYNIYEFMAPDADQIYAMFLSMQRADADHIHAWKSTIVEVPAEGVAVERYVWEECRICGTVETTLPEEYHNIMGKPENTEETEHVHEWTNRMVTVQDEYGNNVQMVERFCSWCEQNALGTEPVG
ncbi:MAG: hypothetical protein IKV66_00445 [Clostridia bacterium]|nr:hypothetical protein [Clostridia bacterium]